MKLSFLGILVTYNIVMARVSYGIKDIKMPVASSDFVLIFALILLITFLVLFFYVKVQEKIKKAMLEYGTLVAFRERCAKFGLTPIETTTLKRCINRVNIPSILSVFDSVAVFEEAIDKECEDIINKWGVTSKAENATLVLHTLIRKLGFDHIVQELPISSTRNIEPGQRFDVMPVKGSSQKLISAVALESTPLVFSFSYKLENALFDLSKSKSLYIEYTRFGDGVYLIPVEIIDVDPASNTIRVHQTNLIERKQYRSFVRIPVDMPLQCRVLGDVGSGSSSVLGQLVEDARIVDLSGGGLAFVSAVILETNTQLSLSFTIRDISFAVLGIVIGFVEIGGRGVFARKYHVSFKNLSHANSEVIIRYIFEIMREQLHVNYHES